MATWSIIHESMYLSVWSVHVARDFDCCDAYYWAKLPFCGHCYECKSAFCFRSQPFLFEVVRAIEWIYPEDIPLNIPYDNLPEAKSIFWAVDMESLRAILGTYECEVNVTISDQNSPPFSTISNHIHCEVICTVHCIALLVVWNLLCISVCPCLSLHFRLSLTVSYSN